MKEKCNTLLNEHKRQIEKYTRAIKSCKEEYAATLLTLELLSENIHESRSKLNLAQLDENNSVNDQVTDVNNLCHYVEDLSNSNEFEIYNDEVSLDSSNPSLADNIEKNCHIESDEENRNIADGALESDDGSDDGSDNGSDNESDNESDNKSNNVADSTLEKECT